VALFALFCLAGGALARDVSVPREEVVAGARGRLSHLDLDLAEDNKPVDHTRAPLEELELEATSKPVTPKAVESGHVGAERGTEDHSEAVSTSTGFPVVTDAATSAAPAETSDATSVPVTDDNNTDANTDASTTEESTDANTESGNTDKVTTESAVTDASNAGSPSTESDSTDSTGTESTATDSTNTEPTEIDGDDKKSKGLSTASISAIVIGGVLALAVIVAVAMAIVRRRRMTPERRGILDA